MRKGSVKAWVLPAAALFGLHAADIQAQTAPAAEAAPTEIIVTAQKREQRLQDVPVAVNVVSSDELQRLNITDVNGLQRAVPSLQLVGGGSGGLQIRGIGTIGYSSTSEPSASIVLDGVVLGRFPPGGLLDVQRIEVLSGPQGMLFGKNASAGVINIVTNAPNFDRFEGKVHFEAGERQYRQAQGVVNVPVTDRFALRASAQHTEYGDIYENTFRGKSHDWNDGGRLKLRWDATDDFTVNASVDYNHTDSNGVFIIVGPIRQVGAGTLLASRLAACGVTPGPDNNRQCTEATSGKNGYFTPGDTYGGSLQLDKSFGDYTLTSITAQRYSNIGNLEPPNTPANDGDNTPLPLISSNVVYARSTMFSQELRLTSPAKQRVEFVAGLYYSRSRGQSVGDIYGTLGAALPPGLLINRYNNTRVYSRSEAVFGQATINATDKLRFIAGARYTDETLSESIAPGVNPGYLLVPTFQLGALNDVRINTSNFSWRLGVQYDVADNVMVFATATRGYKGPQINELPLGSLAPQIVRPEIPMNYEIGVKTSLFDRRIVANATAFRQKVSNFQTNIFIPSASSGSITTFATGNAPFVLTEGVDINIFGRPIPQLEINANLLYDYAAYSHDFIVACKQGSRAGCTTPSNTGVIFAPKWKARLSAEYTQPINGTIEGFLQGDINYTSTYNYSSTPDPVLRAPSFTILGGRIGVRSPNGGWSVALFGRNLTDERVPTIIAADSGGALNGGAGQSYTHNLSLDTYRVVGVAVDFRF